MKKYHIIEEDSRNAHEELKAYTFEELKKFFAPSEELKADDPELAEKWSDVKDVNDLREYLKFEADGMRVEYTITEEEE